MNKALEEKIHKSIDSLLKSDSFLFLHDVSERAISHMLAAYLTKYFPTYNVDCEYNSNIHSENNRKTIRLLKEKAVEFGLIKGKKDKKFNHLRLAYPDIIVHERGTNNNNLIVIEIKKTSNNKSRDFDHYKLMQYTLPEDENGLNYDFGVFIDFEVGKDFGVANFLLFSNGKRVSD